MRARPLKYNRDPTIMPSMNPTRAPAVAGLFYPDDKALLRETVAGLLRKSRPRTRHEAAPVTHPKALIAPHAGFIHSGSIAASAYALIARAKIETQVPIRRVVLLGPTHRVPLTGLAGTGMEWFRTPLGDVPVDRAAMESLATYTQVRIRDDAHALEHSLEVHLPFLQTVLDDFTLIPLVVGKAPPQAVAKVLAHFRGGEETLIVISADLSHYLDYETARERDNATARAIEHLDPGALGPEDTCGYYPLRGLLHLARANERKMTVERLDLGNSGDTAGDKRRVVGYGAWGFFSPPE